MRLNSVGGDRQPAIGSLARRGGVKVFVLYRTERWHQLVGFDSHRPLPNVPEVSRVKRQRCAAVLLPDAVAIAETRERAPMPVVDHPHPRIAEHLTVVRAQVGADRHRILVHWRLYGEARIFECDGA